MERRRFGRTDQLVPVIGQRTWHMEACLGVASPDRAMGKSFAFLRKYAGRDPFGRREVDHSYG
jgi:hypothetical protein